MTHRKISVDDPHVISFEDYGEPGFDPVVVCHGGPGSRVLAPPAIKAYQDAGFRPIGIDRPGYGDSSARPGRLIGDWPADGIAVVDHLSVQRFFVHGSSTGAGYALALAAAASDRVLGVVISCGMSDQRWAAEVDDARMDLADDFWFARDRDAAIVAAEHLYGRNGEHQHEHGPDGREIWSPPDRAVLRSVAALTPDPNNAPFAQGVSGYVDDRIADGPANGWQSFDVSRVRAPTIVVHGEQDWIVPVAQARHTASLVANSELRIFPEHGHLSVGAQALPALVDVRERGKGG